MTQQWVTVHGRWAAISRTAVYDSTKPRKRQRQARNLQSICGLRACHSVSPLLALAVAFVGACAWTPLWNGDRIRNRKGGERGPEGCCFRAFVWALAGSSSCGPGPLSVWLACSDCLLVAIYGVVFGCSSLKDDQYGGIFYTVQEHSRYFCILLSSM